MLHVLSDGSHQHANTTAAQEHEHRDAVEEQQAAPQRHAEQPHGHGDANGQAHQFEQDHGHDLGRDQFDPGDGRDHQLLEGAGLFLTHDAGCRDQHTQQQYRNGQHGEHNEVNVLQLWHIPDPHQVLYPW